MKDTLFHDYNKCPNCGKSKGLYYCIQYPLTVDFTLSGKPFTKKMGKRKTKLTNKYKANQFDSAWHDEYQVANCICDLCGWVSETKTP